MSSATSRFAVVGAGRGALRWYDVGGVAIGTSVIAGVAMCWLAFGTGSSGACCVCVSAVAVACLLLTVCFFW